MRNLDNNFVGALRLVSQCGSLLSHLAALVHLPNQPLYEDVSFCLQLNDLPAELACDSTDGRTFPFRVLTLYATDTTPHASLTSGWTCMKGTDRVVQALKNC
jgi:hypothetical protein